MYNVKQKCFELLQPALSFPIDDNPNNRNKIPYGLLRTVSVMTKPYKNFEKNYWNIKLDMFSKYVGEKEIYDAFEVAKTALKALHDVDEITYVNFDTMIVDDKEQGPVNKHGILSIIVETLELEVG